MLIFWRLLSFHRHPATAKWYDRRDSVFIEFCVADSKDVKVNFDKTKCGFRYVCLMLALKTDYEVVFNYVFFVKCFVGSTLKVYFAE